VEAKTNKDDEDNKPKEKSDKSNEDENVDE
jgi:hypothetical protein